VYGTNQLKSWSQVFVQLEAQLKVPLTLFAVKLPLSSIVAELFCISFPVVKSYLAIALSVDEAGHTTSQLQFVLKVGADVSHQLVKTVQAAHKGNQIITPVLSL
jgi:hypothetical protein